MSALVCPYCGNPARLVDSAVVYGRSYGPIWLCAPCDARVSCHRGTTRPLGTLANEPLREARKRAHAAFDPLWQARPRAMRRTSAYRALALHLGIAFNDCHMALFDAATCERVVQWIATRAPVEAS